jgi:hypothetical protein
MPLAVRAAAELPVQLQRPQAAVAVGVHPRAAAAVAGADLPGLDHR